MHRSLPPSRNTIPCPPDNAPGYGCNGAGTSCALRGAGAFWNAFDGEVNPGSDTYATYSSSVSDFTRFTSAWYQVQLDSAYSDISGIDIWFHPTSNLPNQRNLSIWLSNTRAYNSKYAYNCVSSFSPSVFAPARTRINCTQTLNATRYVTVWRPLFSGAALIYINEMRIVRSVVSATCIACRPVAAIVSAQYSSAPGSTETWTQAVDGSWSGRFTPDPKALNVPAAARPW